MVTLCLAGAVRADEAVQFRHKMDESEKLIYETVTEVDQTQNINGTENKNLIKSREISTHSLLEVQDDGSLKLQSENKLLSVSMDMGQLGKYEFDSKKTDNETGSVLGGSLTPLYETLSGAIIKYARTSRGQVLKVEGLKELLAEVLKDNPIASQFAAGASDKGAVANMNQLTIQFPEKTIKPGDRWEEPFEMELAQFGTLKGKANYTYEGADKVGNRKTAKFSSTTEISIDLDITQRGAKITGTIASTEGSGTIQFDPEKGQIVSLTGTMKMSGNLTVEAGGNTINITQEQTQKMTKKLLDKLPE